MQHTSCIWLRQRFFAILYVTTRLLRDTHARKEIVKQPKIFAKYPNIVYSRIDHSNRSKFFKLRFYCHFKSCAWASTSDAVHSRSLPWVEREAGRFICVDPAAVDRGLLQSSMAGLPFVRSYRGSSASAILQRPSTVGIDHFY